jgi:hypothetical protein
MRAGAAPSRTLAAAGRQALTRNPSFARMERKMKPNTAFSFFAATLLVAFALGAAYAAKPATPKAQLEKEATHIVVGEVRSVSSSSNITGQEEITRYIAEIQVDKVEKGSGVKAADVIRVRYVSYTWRGAGLPPPSDSGHRPRPKQGDNVRVYLVNHGYNGAGYTRDGGYTGIDLAV